MPANRSRTDRWRESLRQIHQRGGGIEFALDNADADALHQPESTPAPDLVWRVRILELSDDAMTLEMPSAAGRNIVIAEGTPIIGMLTVGQNRWMFRTVVSAHAQLPPQLARHCPIGLRIGMPDRVERCMRRQFYRVSTASVSLPEVACYPLLDPMSVAPAEIANRTQILDLHDADLIGSTAPANSSMMLPDVGPAIPARLANVSGGGVGLRIDREDTHLVDSSKLYWLRIDLRPTIPAPLAVTSRMVHQHMDASQDIYAGMAFDFTFNPSQRDFVTGELLRYVSRIRDAA